MKTFTKVLKVTWGVISFFWILSCVIGVFVIGVLLSPYVIDWVIAAQLKATGLDFILLGFIPLWYFVSMIIISVIIANKAMKYARKNRGNTKTEVM
jgi:hypothetical protein